MMHVGDTKSTSGDVQYIGGCCEYSRDIMSTSGDILMHVGEQVDKILSISIENPNVLKSLDVLLISPKVFMISP